MFGRFAFARPLAAATICFALAASAAASPASADPTPKDVIKVYADIAQAAYTDSLGTARTLKLAVDVVAASAPKGGLVILGPIGAALPTEYQT
jgi:putative iron-regulated protein